MLVLSRRENQKIQMTTSDGVITLTVVRIASGMVRLGIEAPETVEVIREDLLSEPCRYCGQKTGDHRIELLRGRMRRICPGFAEQRITQATAEEAT